MTDTVAQVAELLATAQSFRNWLTGDDLNRIVGRAGCTDACPLTEFLVSCDIKRPTVGKYDVEFVVGMKGYQVRLPSWCASFVSAIDSAFPRMSVTAEVCLVVLDAALSHEPHTEAA